MTTTTITPRVIDEPEINQQVNGLPELRIPVPRDEKWQDSKFEDATVRVYKDGDPQPVDTLVDVEVTESGAELVCEGGAELKQRVTANYQFKDAHVAARNLVQNNTSLTTNVDNPATNTRSVTMQDVDTTTEWQNIIPAYPFAATDPRYISGGELRTYQTAQFARAENFDSKAGWSQFFDSSYESGEAYRESGIGNTISWDLTTQYEIPTNDLKLWFRVDYFGSTHPGLKITFGGDTVFQTAADSDFLGGGANGPKWVDETSRPNSNFTGTETMQAEITAAAGDGSNFYLDAVAVVDTRYTQSQIDENLSSGGLLSWPNLYPDSIQTQTQDTTALNQVVGGSLTSTWNNTANNQQIELSNDQGANWPIAGSNTTSVSGSFPSSSGQIRARFTQSYHSPSGGLVKPSGEQTIDLYELVAEQEDTPTLIDRSFDDRLVSILQLIAEDKDFVWELQVDRDYNFSFEMAQPGQRTSDRDTEVVDYQISKSTKDVVEKAVIKGGAQTSREDFTSNHGSFVGLSQDNLVEGSESVFDSSTGTEFDRSDDYEMDYLNGEIQTLAAGNMSDATTYRIVYNHKPQASYTKAGVSSPKTIVRTIPSLQSSQTAEQLAFVLVDKFGSPVYSATATIPDTVGWSVIDEIDPDRIPAAGNRLQISSLTTTPEAVVADLANRERVDEFLGRVQSRLSRTETRV
jgi:hypothetical protein